MVDWIKTLHGWVKWWVRWWVRRSSIGQATRLTSRCSWTGRFRYLYICTAIYRLSLKLCSVKYIVEVVYVKLHIFISQCLNVLKNTVFKKFPDLKGNKLKVYLCILLDFVYVRTQFLPLCMAAKLSVLGLILSSSPIWDQQGNSFPFTFSVFVPPLL